MQNTQINGKQLSAPSELPLDVEPTHAETVEFYVQTKPVEDLPSIDNKTYPVYGEFWGRSKLRPDSFHVDDSDNRKPHGSSFHNMPILHFGIEYQDGTAVLEVPSIDYINRVIQIHNSGGFTFVETTNNNVQESADDFLEGLRNKEFPMSSDKDIRYWGVPDSYNAFQFGAGKDLQYKAVQNISLYEHDRVDHLGLAAVPETEADKIADIAKSALEIDDEDQKSAFSGSMDRVLDLLSDYMISGEEVNSAGQSYRDFLWSEIETYVGLVNGSLGGLDVHKIVKEKKLFEYSERLKKVNEELQKQGRALIFDRAAMDAKRDEMQRLETVDTLSTVGKIGSLAIIS